MKEGKVIDFDGNYLTLQLGGVREIDGSVVSLPQQDSLVVFLEFIGR